MFDKIKELNNLRKVQAEIKKELENIFCSVEKDGIKITLRGDKHVENVLVDGEENKLIRDLFNDAMKEVDKKVEKQMKGHMQDLGLPGL